MGWKPRLKGPGEVRTRVYCAVSVADYNYVVASKGRWSFSELLAAAISSARRKDRERLAIESLGGDDDKPKVPS